MFFFNAIEYLIKIVYFHFYSKCAMIEILQIWQTFTAPFFCTSPYSIVPSSYNILLKIHPIPSLQSTFCDFSPRELYNFSFSWKRKTLPDIFEEMNKMFLARAFKVCHQTFVLVSPNESISSHQVQFWVKSYQKAGEKMSLICRESIMEMAWKLNLQKITLIKWKEMFKFLHKIPCLWMDFGLSSFILE